MIATHAYSINGRSWTELQDSFGPPTEELKLLLGRLDGSERFSLILWKLPEGKYLDETSPERDAQEYLQCAGSAECMVVELRRVVNGQPEQYVVGRGTDAGAPEPRTEVRWNAFRLLVNDEEVFDAGEAFILFQSYYEAGDIPSEYSRRPLTA